MATLVWLLITWLEFEVAETEFGSVLNLGSHTWDHNQTELKCYEGDIYLQVLDFELNYLAEADN